MVSTTSGTTSFNMDVDEIIEQALDALGGEHQSGINTNTARRTLNLLLIELQNKNIPLHKIDTQTITLAANVSSFSLSSSVVDVLELALIKDGTEIQLTRYGVKEYHSIPQKNLTGRPSVFTTERLLNAVKVNLWPIPSDGTYSARILVSKKIEDVNASYQKLDIPSRYLPLVIKWLRYELSLGRQGIPEEVKNRCKNDYLEIIPDTFDEDRERTDIIITLGGISGR